MSVTESSKKGKIVCPNCGGDEPTGDKTRCWNCGDPWPGGRLCISDLPDVLNVKELAAFLGVSEWSVREQVHRNEIPFQRIGEKIVFLKLAILKHLGLPETGLALTTGNAGFEPARVFFNAYTEPLNGWARIEGGFVRFQFAENSAKHPVEPTSFPAHRISHIEWLEDERML